MIQLPHGGVAAAGLDYLGAVEIGPALQTMYLDRIRREYRMRNSARMHAANQPWSEEWAEKVSRSLEQARVDYLLALFTGGQS